VQHAVDDDFVLAEVVVDNVLLDQDTPAAEIELVARVAAFW
jgi:hypothetical protein